MKGKSSEQFIIEVTEAATTIGLSPEEIEEFVVICNMRQKPGAEKARVLFQEYWKHSAPVY